MGPSPGAPEKLPLREGLRRAWARLRGGELTPSRGAWSVALGLFVGTQPTPGLHLPIVLGLCLPFRLDAAVAYVAANISIPPIAPFLWLGAIELGSLLRTGTTLPLTAAGARALMERGPGSLLGTLLVGSVTLGALLAVVGFLATWFVLRARAARALRARAERDPLEAAIERTAERYSRASKSRGTYYYVRGKLRGDPSSRAVAGRAPLGSVLDLGCGRAQLAVLLLESGAASRVRGIDWDEKKVALAREASSGLSSCEFVVGDVRDPSREPEADTVLLIDVVHYFDRATQDALLVAAASRVRPGGTLLIRDADRARGWRSWVTRVQEGIGTAIRFNRGERVLFRDVDREVVPLLESQGLRCEVLPCWGGTPFANVLIVARRLDTDSAHLTPAAARPSPFRERG